jgi:hypothetical protein
MYGNFHIVLVQLMESMFVPEPWGKALSGR